METLKKFEIGTGRDTRKFNDWFKQCQLNQTPYVIVVNVTKSYCRVEWDYFNLDPVFDKMLVSIKDRTRSALVEIFKKHSNKRSEYMITNLTFFTKNIPTGNAEAFASEIYEYLRKELFALRRGQNDLRSVLNMQN